MAHLDNFTSNLMAKHHVSARQTADTKLEAEKEEWFYGLRAL